MPFSFQKRSSYFYTFLIFVATMALKYFLAHASPQTLNFLLWPPAKMVALCFSAPCYWDVEQGYVFPELSIYINKGCAAINFLTILILSLSTLTIFYTPGKLRVKSILLVLLSCYPLCIVVNTLRILTSVQINYFTQSLSLSLRESIHELTGGLCFFGSLLIIVLIAEKILRKFVTPQTYSLTTQTSIV